MSTRCQIGFYEKPGQNLHEPSALIYRHSDGYPEGVLPENLPYCVRFDKGRGMGDVEYLAASLLAHLVHLYDADDPGSPIGDPSPFAFLGYGISDAFHGDLEYYYAVYGTGVVNVYEVDYDRENERRIIFRKLGGVFIRDIPDEDAAYNSLSFYRRNSSR